MHGLPRLLLSCRSGAGIDKTGERPNRHGTAMTNINIFNRIYHPQFAITLHGIYPTRHHARFQWLNLDAWGLPSASRERDFGIVLWSWSRVDSLSITDPRPRYIATSRTRQALLNSFQKCDAVDQWQWSHRERFLS